MRSLNSFKSKIFHINNQNFEQHALDLFHFQYRNNKIYHDYIKHLGINHKKIHSVSNIPFLPIQFFKSQIVKCGDYTAEHVFKSSGTTGNTSKHYIQDLDFYTKISTWIFQSFFGPLKNSAIIGLLPSYLERSNSSLVYMVDHFIKTSENPYSGFYLSDVNDLMMRLDELRTTNNSIYLFGVTFALLEVAKNHIFKNNRINIIETGGMKGRGKELIRDDLHDILKNAFKKGNIFSEYGMTELLSQAYLKRDGYFYAPPWMRIYIRDIYDPFAMVENGKTGIIKIIDLANIHSCSFIETEDLGLSKGDGFKVLGRLDNSDMRGCNLLLT